MEKQIKVKVTFHKEEAFFGPGVAQLMELLVSTGSMKNACREMGLSYTKGWSIINRAEEQLGYKLIERQHGGVAGGSSALTAEGEKLLCEFRELEADIRHYAAEAFARKFPQGL